MWKLLSLGLLVANWVAALPSPPAAEERIEGRDVEERQVAGVTWALPNYCTATTETGYFASLWTALVDQPPATSFSPSSFCSKVVQSTVVEYFQTTSPGVLTQTITSTSTTAISKTSTNKAKGTTTVLCATPSPSMQCGIIGNGYSTNLISENYISATDCNQLCLKTTGCKSFQNVPQNNGATVNNLCNLYNVYVAGNTDDSISGIKAVFYDRDCGDLLPAGCSAPRPTITPAPSPSLTKKALALEKREYSVPSFLSSQQLIFLGLACSCLITTGPAATTLSITYGVNNWVSVTITTEQTIVYPFTVYPDLKTVYKSVS